MASPQLENGHTQIANELLEHLITIHLPPNQWQVLLCIIRKTYGYRKKTDYIANTQIVEDTHLCKAVVSRALQGLINRNIVTRNGKNIGIEKDWECWQELAESSTKVSSIANKLGNEKLAISTQELAISTQELAESSTKVSSPRIAQKKKETYTKETIQKKGDCLSLPEWLNKEQWNAFVEMRKRIKKPLTNYAERLTISKLEIFRANGEDVAEILNRSIMASWQGLFPLKEKEGGTQNGGIQTNRGSIPGNAPSGAFAGLET